MVISIMVPHFPAFGSRGMPPPILMSVFCVCMIRTSILSHRCTGPNLPDILCLGRGLNLPSP